MARLAVVCLSWVVFAQAAWGSEPGSGFWQMLGKQFAEENPRIEGTWKERQDWKAWGCNGHYQYNTRFGAALKDLHLALQDEGYVVATVKLENLHAHAAGEYRSKASLCLPASGWLGAASSWGVLQSEVHFGDSGRLSDLRIKVVSTRLGKLDLGRYVPGWFEEFFTGVVNRGLSVVWNSFLGRWVNQKLTQYAQERLGQFE